MAGDFGRARRIPAFKNIGGLACDHADDADLDEPLNDTLYIYMSRELHVYKDQVYITDIIVTSMSIFISATEILI